MRRSIAVVLLAVGLAASGEPDVFAAGSETRIVSHELLDQYVDRRPSEYLRHLSRARKKEARLDVELVGAPTAVLRAWALEIGSLWSSGRYDDSLYALAKLEDRGLAAGVGISWSTQLSAAGPRKADYPIISSGGADEVVLDFEPASGNLFAVVRLGSDWALSISTDQGATWSESFQFDSFLLSGRDLDLAVHGSYVYVASSYARNIVDTSAAFIRRFSAATGAPDDSWGSHTVRVESTRRIREIGLAIADGGSNSTVYYVLLLDDNKILCDIGSTASGSAWGSEPTFIDNALRGLDVAYPGAGASYHQLYISYRGDDDTVYLSRLTKADTDFQDPEPMVWSPVTDKTSVAALLNVVVMAWEHEFGSAGNEVQGVRYVKGVESSSTFTVWQPSDDSWAGGTNYYDPLLAAGGGRHGMIYERTSNQIIFGAYESMLAPWPDETSIFTEHDFVLGAGDHFAFEWLGHGYGIAYVGSDGGVYFHKTWLFSDGFESGTDSEWSSSAP